MAATETYAFKILSYASIATRARKAVSSLRNSYWIADERCVVNERSSHPHYVDACVVRVGSLLRREAAGKWKQ